MNEVTRRGRGERQPRARGLALAVLSGLVVACGGEDGTEQPPAPMTAGAPAIQYPLELWDQGVQGEAEIMVHVDEFGAVDSALVSRSSGQAAFDSAALQGVRAMRFAPGRRGDERVAMWTRLPIRFSQDSTQTAPRASGVSNR